MCRHDSKTSPLTRKYVEKTAYLTCSECSMLNLGSMWEQLQVNDFDRCSVDINLKTRDQKGGDFAEREAALDKINPFSCLVSFPANL